jgi:uncharacterized protein YndB with AHSA1/START domain
MSLTNQLGEKPTTAHCTYVIERAYPAAPEYVFAALADPAKKRRWFADGDTRNVEEFTSDFRVGGAEITRRRMSADTPFPGVALTNYTTYHDIVPNRRVVFAYSMTIGDRRISTSLVTIELLATAAGTDMIFTDQGAYFEGADGPQMREQGWRKLLDSLAREVTSGATHAPAEG